MNYSRNFCFFSVNIINVFSRNFIWWVCNINSDLFILRFPSWMIYNSQYDETLAHPMRRKGGFEAPKTSRHEKFFFTSNIYQDHFSSLSSYILDIWIVYEKCRGVLWIHPEDCKFIQNCVSWLLFSESYQ